MVVARQERIDSLSHTHDTTKYWLQGIVQHGLAAWPIG